MREHQSSFDAAGLQIFVVTFESAQRVREYQESEPVAFPMLRDPRRQAYREFGFARDHRKALAAPKTTWYYLRSALHGKLPQLRASDMVQLGGDVVLSASGDVCWRFASQEPADRPSIEEILTAVNACRDDQ